LPQDFPGTPVEEMASTAVEYETTQKFSRRGLGFLWGKRTELDPGQVAILQSLYNNRKKGSLTGIQKITYKLSKSKAGRLRVQIRALLTV